jgi:hypothetical protein
MLPQTRQKKLFSKNMGVMSARPAESLKIRCVVGAVVELTPAWSRPKKWGAAVVLALTRGRSPARPA